MKKNRQSQEEVQTTTVSETAGTVEVSSEVATPTTKVKQRWNLDNLRFAEVYETCGSSKEVAEKLGVPEYVVNTRAAYLRNKKGVNLKSFQNRPKIDANALNARLAELRQGPQAPATVAE